MNAAFLVNYSLICLISYLIGSIPFSYIVLKKKFGIDVTQSGSGNAGAMNSYETTNSKSTGLLVLLLDFIKGVIPLSVMAFYLKMDLNLITLPALFIIIGHNFSVWLKFKGGRGLATAAGMAAVVNFWMIIIWLLLFALGFFVKRNVHIGNVFATILLPLAVAVMNTIINPYNFDAGWGTSSERLLFPYIGIICIVILIKHIQPIIELIKVKKTDDEKS